MFNKNTQTKSEMKQIFNNMTKIKHILFIDTTILIDFQHRENNF